MILNYYFDEGNYDYELSYDDLLIAVKKILSSCSQEELIQIILNYDECKVDLFQEYYEELRLMFQGKAEIEFYEMRNE